MLLNDLFEGKFEDELAALLGDYAQPAASISPLAVKAKKTKYKPLSPGDKRTLKVHIGQLQEKYKEIQAYHDNLTYFMQKLPPGLEEELDQLELEYRQAIERELQVLKSSTEDAKVYKFLDGIKNKCSQSVQAMQQAGTMLFRGTSNIGNLYIGKPIENRRTMTSSRSAQKVYDETIAKAGFKALRGNSIFTSGSLDLASGFGSSKYMIFPVNGFDFTWSETRRDIVIGDSDLPTWRDLDLIKNIWNKVFLKKEIRDEFLARFSKMPRYGFELGPVDDIGDLPNELTSDQAGSFYGFLGYEYGDTQFKILKDMQNEGLIDGIPEQMNDLITPQSLVSHMGLRNDDFVAALESEHEICIRGTYYAIQFNYYKLVKSYLNI